MCWTSNKSPVKEIAKEDIPVFKVMKLSDYGRLISQYWFFEYEVGKTYSIEIDKNVGACCNVAGIPVPVYYIGEGFHSYSSKCIIENNPFRSMLFVINTSDRSINWTEIKPDISYVRVECVIPKGSEYYLNEYDEYVSNKIKIIEYTKL